MLHHTTLHHTTAKSHFFYYFSPKPSRLSYCLSSSSRLTQHVENGWRGAPPSCLVSGVTHILSLVRLQHLSDQ
ncbi:hypothetical protein E2C01_039265 [Portunus trituberculatus]|uniref:Uncharacterized protein n=1 Tax=Portunus trituberculatus TaxID=210409 RepID=A0A5B7FGE5_PORTR|nr:hypothetical protein [Portunus trituberculatus]